MQLPALFVERMRMQLGEESEAFLASLHESPPVSVRLHHQKGHYALPVDTPVPWCETGYYLPARPAFYLDPHWHAGAYYVQEASSMILDDVLRQHIPKGTSRTWLDLCAAPGGKTGIMAKHMDESDALVANEVVPQRRTVLKENLVKGGFLNTFISGMQPDQFPDDFADIILLDAPCAGEGMMRKEPEAIQQWSTELVNSCARLQHTILTSALRTLKPGGYLLYSTCSYSMEENIRNVQQALQTGLTENLPCQFPEAWNIAAIDDGRSIGYQLYPHRVRGEGLFMAVLRKKLPGHTNPTISHKVSHSNVSGMLHEMIDKPGMLARLDQSEYIYLVRKEALPTIARVRHALPKAALSPAATVKGRDIIPSHFLAMSGLLTGTMEINLSKEEALDYLERKSLVLDPTLPNGWHVPTFDGSQLGWLKKISGGWKNHYPMDWRLRKRT